MSPQIMHPTRNVYTIYKGNEVINSYSPSSTLFVQIFTHVVHKLVLLCCLHTHNNPTIKIQISVSVQFLV